MTFCGIAAEVLDKSEMKLKALLAILLIPIGEATPRSRVGAGAEKDDDLQVKRVQFEGILYTKAMHSFLQF